MTIVNSMSLAREISRFLYWNFSILPWSTFFRCSFLPRVSFFRHNASKCSMHTYILVVYVVGSTTTTWHAADSQQMERRWIKMICYAGIKPLKQKKREEESTKARLNLLLRRSISSQSKPKACPFFVAFVGIWSTSKYAWVKERIINDWLLALHVAVVFCM